jgi:hypothetical protein
MDTRSFDRLAVAMASASSRRRVLGGLAAALGLSIGAPVAAKKGGNGKGNGGGNGGGNAYGRKKVPVCKVAAKDDAGVVTDAVLKFVPKPAVQAFVRQGGSDCSAFVVPACQKVACSENATCTSEPDDEQDGDECPLDAVTTGVCASGTCTEVEAPPTA